MDNSTGEKSDGITILPFNALWLRDPIDHLRDSTVGSMDVATTGFLASSVRSLNDLDSSITGRIRASENRSSDVRPITDFDNSTIGKKQCIPLHHHTNPSR